MPLSTNLELAGKTKKFQNSKNILYSYPNFSMMLFDILVLLSFSFFPLCHACISHGETKVSYVPNRRKQYNVYLNIHSLPQPEIQELILKPKDLQDCTF